MISFKHLKTTMGTITNLKDFLKELVSLENNYEDPAADVWYEDLLRGKSTFPGQPNHIMIWWELDDNNPELKRIKDEASILRMSSFVDIREKQILVYDDRNDYDDMGRDGEWIIMSYDEFSKWIVEYDEFINKPIPFEYEPIQIFEEEDDVFDNEDYNKDLRCDEIIKIRDILDYHKDAIEEILETYENDIHNTIHWYYFRERKLYYELKAIDQSMTNKVKSFIEMLFFQHDIKDSVLSVDAGITYRRWCYPGEVIIGCIIYI